MTDVQTSAMQSTGNTTRSVEVSGRRKALASPAKRRSSNGTNDPSSKTHRGAVRPPATFADVQAEPEPTVIDNDGSALVVRELRPRQVQAANLLVQGMQGKEVAMVMKVAEETVSRWRQQPEFQALMRDLLQESVDATKLGLVSLCVESIVHLRGLVRSFDDATALKAISLILGKVGPVLGVIGTDLASTAVTRARNA